MTQLASPEAQYGIFTMLMSKTLKTSKNNQAIATQII